MNPSGPTPDDIILALQAASGPRPLFAYLLGSACTPRFREDSDIDLAVFWEAAPAPESKFALANELAERLGRDVDLIQLNEADPIIGRQVLETGRLLFCHEADMHFRWKLRQLSIYPDFKATRSVVEKNILKRRRHA